MGKLKLGSWAVILREVVEKWSLYFSGKMDRRRAVETFCSNLQMRMNLMKILEERSVGFTLENEKGMGEEEYIYILSHCGLDWELRN
jgi:hypothetical protein